MKSHYGLDIIGDIGILNFHSSHFKFTRKKIARKILKENRSLKTILEKVGRVSGRLRKTKFLHLAGVRKKETIHKENGCKFYLNVEDTYFSPRLSNERKIVCEGIARKAKNNSKVLVMFAGVAPFPIVLAKFLKQRKKKVKIISSELNKKASEYAKKNVQLNKVGDYVSVISGDSQKLKTKEKFDFILMPRPNLKDTFLDIAWKFSKKGARIYYYGFGIEEDVLKEVKDEIGKKARILCIRKAGDIAPRKFRFLVEIKKN